MQKATIPIIIATALVLGWLTASRMVASIDYRNSDFFSFYLAGWMNWQGQDPYSNEQWSAGVQHFKVTWMPVSIFPYPLPLATFLSPLGLLDLYYAFVVWVFISGILVFLSCNILLPQNNISHRASYLLPLLAGAFLFRPTLVTFHDGQLGAFLLFIIGCTILLWYKGWWFAGGILLGIISLKPTLGFPILGFVGLWLVFHRRLSGLAGLAVSGIILAVIGFAMDGNWPADFLSVGNRDLTAVFGITPTVWGVSGVICRYQQGCIWLLGGLLATGLSALIIYYLWIMRGVLDPLSALGIIAAAAVTITPYILAYDQILVLATVIATVVIAARRNFPYLATASFPILLSALSVVLVLVAMRIGRDHWSALVPLLSLVILITVLRFQRMSQI